METGVIGWLSSWIQVCRRLRLVFLSNDLTGPLQRLLCFLYSVEMRMWGSLLAWTWTNVAAVGLKSFHSVFSVDQRFCCLSLGSGRSLY